MSDNYYILIRKLDEFIRKYYKNRLIRGGLLFLSIALVFYLLINLAEYFGRFDILARTVIFYLYLVANVFVLWRWVIVPLFHLLKFGKIISHEEAARIIGNHFPEVSDKLLNTLQLHEIGRKEGMVSRELIEASIAQRTAELQPVPFKKAIDFKTNRKYLKYAVPPVIVLLLLLITTPRVVTEPTSRLIRYSEHFEEPLPFTVNILNEDLQAVQQEDFTLEAKAVGEELPAEVFIELDGFRYRLNKISPDRFRYTFTNIRDDKNFRLTAGPFRSREYTIRVLPKPIILSFEMELDYPSYTGKKDEVLENTGDVVIPEGTGVNWRFFTRDTRIISFSLAGEKKLLESEGSNTFEYAQRIRKSTLYSVVTENQFMKNEDSLLYSVSVIPDVYPAITVEEFVDSTYDKRLYYRGVIKDDYGFSRLSFSYKVKESPQEDNPSLVSLDLPLERSQTQQQFFHFFNLDSVNVQPGDELEYYFEVWDNDGVNGAKKTRSQVMTYRLPTREELEKETDESREEIENNMENAIRDLQSLQKDIEKLNRRMMEKEELGWQEKQQIQDLLDKHKNIEETVKEIEKENRRKSMKENQFKEMDEELLRKQQKLEEMFNELMTEEMKKLFEELQQLMEELDKDKVNEMLEEMKLSNEDLEKQLDRNLELFKQLEFEKMLEEAIRKLDELTEKQEQLAKETEEKSKDDEKLKEEQDKLNEEFDKLRQDLDQMHEKNKELERPNNIDETDQEEESIQEDMQQSSDELQKGNGKKSSGAQKNASDKMKKLSQKMKDMQNSMYMEGLGEDIGALREILENLLQLSFDQEDLIGLLEEVVTSDPRYIKVIQEQNRIGEDLEMVEDSLFALSKRNQMIEPFVTKEIEMINKNVQKAVENLNDRKPAEAAGNQQYVMTSINNLALLLSEALEQMMSAMQMQGSGQCSKGNPKPGGGSSSMKSMRQLQEQLNKQLEDMKQGMQDGKGQQINKGQPTMSEQLARMAAQQEAIRRMMEGYQEELKRQGEGNSKELEQMMKEMEQTETDLVNKIITDQMLERQKEILVRLMKHEKAELERERDEQRESKEAKDEIYSNPNEFLEYKRVRSKEVELLRTIPPNLRPFYRNKINDYLYNSELD